MGGAEDDRLAQIHAHVAAGLPWDEYAISLLARHPGPGSHGFYELEITPDGGQGMVFRPCYCGIDAQFAWVRLHQEGYRVLNPSREHVPVVMAGPRCRTCGERVVRDDEGDWHHNPIPREARLPLSDHDRR